jgi:hypothetical protein
MKLVRVFLLLVVLSAAAAAQDDGDDCPASQFEGFGLYGVVTPGDANNLRTQPSAAGSLIGKVEPGEPFRVAYSDPVCAGGYLWREIDTPTLSGWTAEMTADGGDPFIVPFEEPEPRDVGMMQNDGSILVDDSGVSFTVPAALGVASVTVQPELGLFGSSMGAQPSSVVFGFLDVDGGPQGEIEVYPFAVDAALYDVFWDGSALEPLLEERPRLAEFAADRSLPYFPDAGAAALFDGVPAYVPFGSGDGVRFVTKFAQDSVDFDAAMIYSYQYRGLSANAGFLVAARLPVRVPAAAIPAPVSRDADVYVPYLREFEANLAAQPTSAFTPDLAALDQLLASLTIVDPAALLELIP